ncbi:MAG: hypothetical protein EZS28_047473 [Streblomastix strix]|uniref:Uncharacterized protein n=1 Tax=Streblomastix strix TaxID=222440 RepID=A0A5J4TGZ4_9EUKA|nr:MAG: hypothetical protein EZS28_047473 [Streblomastix strix]
MAMGEVLKTLSIHPQSLTISKEEIFDQPLTQLTSGEVKYTRAPHEARGSVIVTAAVADNPTASAITNFNALADITAVQTVLMTAGMPDGQGYDTSEVLHFWLGFSTACGPFNQFAIRKDSTN